MEILRETTWPAIRWEKLANANRSGTETPPQQRGAPIVHQRANMTCDSRACRARGPYLRWSEPSAVSHGGRILVSSISSV